GRAFGPAGKIEEALQDLGSDAAAADDDQRAVLGPFDDRIGGQGRKGRKTNQNDDNQRVFHNSPPTLPPLRLLLLRRARRTRRVRALDELRDVVLQLLVL